MLARVLRYPIKSMRGEDLPSAVLTERGIDGDRGRTLIDTTGHVVSAKHPRKWGRMLTLAARGETETSSATIIFPDGREMYTSDTGVDAAPSAFLGRAVHLSGTAPPQATIERIDPIVAGELVLETEGRATTTSILTRGAPEGTFFDYAPLHVITTASLGRLQDLALGSQFDAARFRPNLLLELPSIEPFAENEWRGAHLHVGAEVVLRVDLPTPRCAVPTLAQPGLPPDPEVIRSIALHNRVIIEGVGCVVCMGADGHVVQGGVVHVGATVRLEQAPSQS